MLHPPPACRLGRLRAGLPCALAACALLAAGGCRTEPPLPSAPEAPGGVRPSVEVWGANLFVSEIGKPRVHIRAAYLAKYTRGDTTYTLMRSASDTSRARVVARLYDAEGRFAAMLTARELKWFEAQGRYEARGGVRVVTPEGRTLQSENLVWDQTARRVRTLGFVRIRTDREQLQGYDLEADENLETYNLARVTGLVTVEEG